MLVFMPSVRNMGCADFMKQTFGEISKQVVKAASEQGLIQKKDVESISADEIDKLSSHASAILGTNAREHAQRAKKILGWSPHNHSLEDEIPKAVKAETETKRTWSVTGPS